MGCLKVILNLDHPIHPPVYEGDPFDVEVQPSLNCRFEFRHGVVHIFDKNDKPFSDFVYPELKMFVDDYHLMVNLISNGPL
jgi:hypothetical protein